MKLPGCKGRPARKADNITAICEPIVQKMWEPRRLTSLRASTACYRDNFFYCPVSTPHFIVGAALFSITSSDQGISIPHSTNMPVFININLFHYANESCRLKNYRPFWFLFILCLRKSAKGRSWSFVSLGHLIPEEHVAIGTHRWKRVSTCIKSVW
jgi:hypothetical protein